MLRPATQRQQWRLGPAKHKHQPGSKSQTSHCLSYRHLIALIPPHPSLSEICNADKVEFKLMVLNIRCRFQPYQVWCGLCRSCEGSHIVSSRCSLCHVQGISACSRCSGSLLIFLLPLSRCFLSLGVGLCCAWPRGVWHLLSLILWIWRVVELCVSLWPLRQEASLMGSKGCTCLRNKDEHLEGSVCLDGSFDYIWFLYLFIN